MKNRIRLKDSRTARPARLAAAVAVAAVVAGGAGIASGRGNAAPPIRADRASHLPQEAEFKHPKLKHAVLTIEGTAVSDKIALRLKAGQPDILQVDVGDDGSADFDFERREIAKIAVDARAGDDLVRIDESNGVFTDSSPTTIGGNDAISATALVAQAIALTLDGGSGDDTIAGGQGIETLLGGDGNDSIDGNRGSDVALMGAGDDTFVWDPGDGSDTVEGQDGHDTMLFNGSNAAEQIDLSANGHRLRFLRDVASVTMDTAGVERVDFDALGGADLVTVSDLTGTDVTSVNVDLEGTPGGAGDGQPDRVVVNGTNGNDTIDVNGDAGGVKVSGLAATVGVLHSEAANDRLEINTLAGRDTVDSGGLAAGVIQLFVDGALVP